MTRVETWLEVEQEYIFKSNHDCFNSGSIGTSTFRKKHGSVYNVGVFRNSIL